MDKYLRNIFVYIIHSRENKMYSVLKNTQKRENHQKICTKIGFIVTNVKIVVCLGVFIIGNIKSGLCQFYGLLLKDKATFVITIKSYET